MLIFIKAKPKAKEEKVEKISQNSYLVAVKEEPKNNKANMAIIKALAKFFKVSPGSIKIKSGHTSKTKLIEVIF